MSRKVYTVAPRGERWSVTARGNERASALTDTKGEAVTRAVEFAHNAGQAQVVIKGQDGRIQSERTYGSDPFPPKG